MFANKHYPEILYPDELDAYLAKGWYRMGQTIFTTHFLFFDNNVYSAIWVRLPLADYRFRKRLRKIIQRNQENFEVKIRQGFISREKEALFQKYREAFNGRLAPNLKDYLLDGEDYNIYNTFEVAVYDDDRLVAFSFFDMGSESAASIIGVYDPDYSKQSLGFFTMLMEIAHCLEKGMDFYYPGYVVPGYQRFDYKLRIGEVAYFEPGSSSWLPYADLSPEKIPVNYARNRLRSLQYQLEEQGIHSKLLIYPFFEANLFNFWQAQYFDFPFLLKIELAAESYFRLIVSYDVKNDGYHLLKCISFEDTHNYFNKDFLDALNPSTHLNEILIIEQFLLSNTIDESMAGAVAEELTNVSFYEPL